MADTLDRAKLFRSGGVSLNDLGVTDGSSGQVLTTNGSGELSFKTAASFQNGIPVQPAVTSSRILTMFDAGNLVRLEDGAGVTLESATFEQGDVITLYNAHTSTAQLTIGSGVTAFIAGSTEVAGGAVALSKKALCIVVCVGSEEFALSGVGVLGEA